MLTFREKIKLVRIAACLIVAYLIVAIFQEKIFKKPYGSGDSKEVFRLATAYVGIQCFAYTIIAGGILM